MYKTTDPMTVTESKFELNPKKKIEANLNPF